MKTIWSSSLFVVLFGVLAFGCQVSPVNKQKQAQNNNAGKLLLTGVQTVHACNQPRSQMCTKEYRPVCAKVDTGVRCVKAPCPSTKLVTKSNACVACADKDVFSYVEGACEAKNK